MVNQSFFWLRHHGWFCCWRRQGAELASLSAAQKSEYAAGLTKNEKEKAQREASAKVAREVKKHLGTIQQFKTVQEYTDLSRQKGFTNRFVVVGQDQASSVVAQPAFSDLLNSAPACPAVQSILIGGPPLEVGSIAGRASCMKNNFRTGLEFEFWILRWVNLDFGKFGLNPNLPKSKSKFTKIQIYIF